MKTSATVSHCGHPTANYPWGIHQAGVLVASPSGMAFKLKKDALAAADLLDAGDLVAHRRAGLGPDFPPVARTPRATDSIFRAWELIRAAALVLFVGLVLSASASAETLTQQIDRIQAQSMKGMADALDAGDVQLAVQIADVMAETIRACTLATIRATAKARGLKAPVVKPRTRSIPVIAQAMADLASRQEAGETVPLSEILDLNAENGRALAQLTVAK